MRLSLQADLVRLGELEALDSYVLSDTSLEWCVYYYRTAHVGRAYYSIK